eukprot:m.55696 g.55696  ORF g.55696 m.55696 type:complete len:784 (+) comp11509_c0_seq1:887-3238(+)
MPPCLETTNFSISWSCSSASTQLTSINDTLFSLMPNLERLDIRDNALTQFPEVVWDSCPHLTRLIASRNRMTTVPRPKTPMQQLLSLNINGNTLTSTGAELCLFSRTANWSALFPNLMRAVFSNNPDLDMQATLPLKLNALSAAGTKHTRLESRADWDYVGVGWPNMEPGFDPCPLLSSEALQIEIIGSDLASITLRCSANTVNIQNNTNLRIARFMKPMIRVDLSNNKVLSQLEFLAVGTSYLDISRTDIPPNPLFCRMHGVDIFIADEMKNTMWSHEVEETLRTCTSGNLHFFSLRNTLNASDNIASLSEFQRSLQRSIAITRDDKEDTALNTQTLMAVPVVPNYPAMDVETEGIQCDLRIYNQRYFPEHDVEQNSWRHLPTVFQECTCGSGYHEVSGTNGNVVCKRDSIGGMVAGVSVAGLLVGMALLYGLQRFKHYRTTARKTGLLLDYATNQVNELKQAWEIDFQDVSLLRRIDEESPGAFGEVWLARWRGAEVAVKLLQSHVLSLESEVEAFGQEVEFLRKTRHTNLVQFFGAGTDNLSPFLVIEYCAFGSLARFLYTRTETKDVSVYQRLQFATDTAAGLEYLHTRGVIHRDIKSGNVLISSKLRAKITDFGSIRQFFESSADSTSVAATASSVVASFFGSTSSDSSELLDITYGVGTPMYMSPEALGSGPPITNATDVFSFGVLLWEIFVQHYPDLFSALQIRRSGPLLTQTLNLLLDGHRMPVDELQEALEDYHALKQMVADLYTQCVSAEAAERPSMSTVQHQLTLFASDFCV